jgi:hypothetical protein
MIQNPPTPLKCCKCGKLVAKASDLLRMPGDTVSGCCHECSGILGDNQFRRRSCRSWALQTRKPQNTRDAAFCETMAKVMAECPGEPKVRLRKITLERLRTTEKMSLGTYNAGCLVDIVKGVTVSIMCRRTNCLFYGMDDQWIKQVNSKHFRCPQCGHLYKSLTSGLPAHKVVRLTDPIVGGAVCFPAIWATSIPNQSLDDIIEMEALKIHTGDNIDVFMNTSAVQLHNLLVKVAMPIHFGKMEWNLEIEHMLHPSKFPETQWGHLKNNGVYGMKGALGSDTVVSNDWQEFVSLMASLLVGARAVGSRL